MSNQTEEVDQFLRQLEHPLKKEVEELRTIILDSNEQISEHVKWKAPSFCFNGDDRVTLNLHAKDHIKLIFHRGAKVKDNKDFTFKDETGLLEWLADDRAVVKLYDIKELKAKKEALVNVVNRWMESTA